jgi:hypothetical protein
MYKYVWRQTDLPIPEWDAYCTRFGDYNYQQTSAAAGLGRTSKGSAFQALLHNGDEPVAMSQGVLRVLTVPRLAVASVRGGPLFIRSESEALNLRYLKEFLKQTADHLSVNFRFYYINLVLQAEATIEGKIALRELGWTPPLFERSPHLTYVVPILGDPDSNLRAFDSKWRNQLRRAESFSPRFEWGRDDSLYMRYERLHNEMCKLKKMRNFEITQGELLALKQLFGDRVFVLIGSLVDQDVCGCIIIVTSKKAAYYYAAANEAARAKYISNALVWRLIGLLREFGIDELDLTGIDPWRNWGGYHFKKGVGGRAVEYLGEWECASDGFIKNGINLLLYLRSSRLYRHNNRPGL